MNDFNGIRERFTGPNVTSVHCQCIEDKHRRKITLPIGHVPYGVGTELNCPPPIGWEPQRPQAGSAQPQSFNAIHFNSLQFSLATGPAVATLPDYG